MTVIRHGLYSRILKKQGLTFTHDVWDAVRDTQVGRMANEPGGQRGMGTQRTGDTEGTTSGDKAGEHGAKRVDKEAKQDARGKQREKVKTSRQGSSP